MHYDAHAYIILLLIYYICTFLANFYYNGVAYISVILS